MNVTVLGIGYVGLVTATCLAEIGNDVVCFDVDGRKIDLLASGGVPFHERDLPEMVARNVGHGRLRFTTDIARAVQHGELIFIATGTPAGVGRLASGDMIEVEVSGVGILRNTVR